MGDLGESLLKSIAIIAGEVKGSASVGLYHGDSPVRLREEIQEKVKKIRYRRWRTCLSRFLWRNSWE